MYIYILQKNILIWKLVYLTYSHLISQLAQIILSSKWLKELKRKNRRILEK